VKDGIVISTEMTSEMTIQKQESNVWSNMPILTFWPSAAVCASTVGYLFPPLRR
jgi:hypothetical protein